MPDKPQTLYLIDGHALLYRSYHAIRPGSMMAADRKTPTNAVFGFAMEIRKLRTRFKPDYIAAVFDPHGKVHREDRYNEYASRLGAAFSGYKSHRDAVPDDLRPQIDIAFELCAGYGIPSYQMEGYEADDVIGTLATIACKQNIKTVIVTGDKDLMQLVCPQIEVYDPLKDIIFDEDTVFSVKGVKPSQVVDWLGFQGDAVDNIPGVAGVGAQTAIKLLQEHGSMDAALDFIRKKFADKEREIIEFVIAHESESLKENKDERKAIKPPKGVKVVEAYLFAQGERARACRELARLDIAIPLNFELDSMRLNPPEVEKLAPLLRRLDFKTFLRDLDQEHLAAFETRAAEEAAKTAPSGPAAPELKSERIDDAAKFKKFVTEFNKQKRFAFSIDTTSVSPRASEVAGIAICWNDAIAHYIPIRGPMGTATLVEKDVLAALKPQFEDDAVLKYGHGTKHEIQILRNHDISLRNIAFDTLIAGWLLEPSALRLTIEELALQHLGLRDAGAGDVAAKKKIADEGDMLAAEDIGRQACLTADYVWRLSADLAPKIQAAGLEKLLHELEIPLTSVLADMEWLGIRVDADFLRSMSGRLEIQLATQEAEIYELAKERFNISSPKQLAAILFEKLGLQSKSTTATGQASTSEEVLLALSKEHELPKKILDYRGALKLKNTYVDALPLMILSSTGRIHARFHQTGAETGRLSSSDPNLQNIPIRGELGRTIRAAFKPGFDGWKLLSADYSQIELRILAHYCQDKQLLEAFDKGVDIHTAVAASLNSVSEKEVTADQRSQAKAVNFGILYGQTAFGLAAVLGIGRRQAQGIIDAYFESHPGVRQCINEIIAVARDQGFVTTVLGRRRFIPQLRAADRGARMLGERLAVNTVFQGSAADLIKRAMIDIHAALLKAKMKSKLLLTIHDELLFEAPPDEVKALEKLVKSKMEGALELKAPLVVEVGVGDDWLTAK